MRAPRTDANQPEIVAALRQAGCTVQLLHMVGEGCPDILVGRYHTNFLLEIKDGSLRPSERELNKRQVEWHINWRGQVMVVTSVAEALAAVGITERPDTAAGDGHLREACGA